VLLFGHAVLLLAASAFLMLSHPQAVQWGGVPTYVASFLLTVSAAVEFSAVASSPFSARSRMALLAVSSIMSFYLCETGIRVFGPPNDPSKYRATRLALRAERAHESGVPFDTRTHLQVVIDIRKDGKAAFPSASFVTFLRESDGRAGSFLPIDTERSVNADRERETLPLGHPSNVTAVGVDNENGYYSVFETDEHGFRNPRGSWLQPVIDIVAVGDSFTEGCEVHDQESFKSQVRNRFPQTINLGLGGGGPFTMLACLREYGSVLRPKAVLWCFYEGNDLDDMIRRSRTPILTNYLERGVQQDLIRRQPEIDSALRSYLDNAVEQEKQRRTRNRSQMLTLENVMQLGMCKRTRSARLGINGRNSFPRRLVWMARWTTLEPFGSQYG
jgi:hypothetical protein